MMHGDAQQQQESFNVLHGEMEVREEVAGQDYTTHTICNARSFIYSYPILSGTRHKGCGKAQKKMKAPDNGQMNSECPQMLTCNNTTSAELTWLHYLFLI